LSRGLAYHHKKNYDRAIVDFDKAIELELNMINADLGQRKDDSKKRDENETLDFHKLVQTNPGNRGSTGSYAVKLTIIAAELTLTRGTMTPRLPTSTRLSNLTQIDPTPTMIEELHTR
jgi:hypothetical protein